MCKNYYKYKDKSLYHFSIFNIIIYLGNFIIGIGCLIEYIGKLWMFPDYLLKSVYTCSTVRGCVQPIREAAM